MTSSDPTRDPALTDLAWVGYNPLAMIPLLTLAGVVSAVLWTGRWYLEVASEFAEAVGIWIRFVLAWGVWPALAGVFLYRTVTYTFRLTDRILLVDFGPLCRRVTPLPLADVTAVVTGGGWLARWLGVGWVEIHTNSQRLRLPGIRNPAGFAELVRVQVAASRHVD